MSGFFVYCRDDKTRTCDLYVPNVARYQLRHIPIPYFQYAKIIYFFYSINPVAEKHFHFITFAVCNFKFSIEKR